MKFLNDEGGGIGGCWKFLNDGGDGGGDSPLSLLLSFPSFLRLFSLFCMIKSIPGSGAAFLTRSLVVLFLPTSSSRNTKPTTGFSASKVETFWKTSSRGFSLLNMFFTMGSNFYLKLALLILSWVTKWLMLSCMHLEKLLVTNRCFCISPEGISASLAILP